MDLETAVLSRYQGEARLQRLLWIASQSPAAYPEALSAARLIATQNGNLRRVKEILHLQLGQSITSENTSADATNTWLLQQQETNRQARDVLHQRLQVAKAHLNKEAIRVAYLALADFDEKTGDLNEAFHSSLRAKDYCTNRNQTIHVSICILQRALYLQNYKTVQEYAHKLSHTSIASTNISTDAPLSYKVAIAAGLERLAARDYAAAAQQFIEALYTAAPANTTNASHATDTSNNNNSARWETGEGTSSSAVGTVTAASASSATETFQWSAVLAPEDVALFAAFLAMAAVDSRKQLVALAEHPEALELVPLAREALLLASKRANFKQAWIVLDQSVFPLLRHDLYMALHLDQLRNMIREKFLMMHWSAFERIHLSVLQQHLGTGILPDPVQDWIVRLLTNRKPNRFPPDTRLDTFAGTLIRTKIQSATASSVNKNRAWQSQMVNDTYCMIIRLACVENDLNVLDPQSRTNIRRGRLYMSDTAGNDGNLAASDGDEQRNDDEDNDEEDDNHNSYPEDSDDFMTNVDDIADAHMVDANTAGHRNPEDLY